MWVIVVGVGVVCFFVVGCLVVWFLVFWLFVSFVVVWLFVSLFRCLGVVFLFGTPMRNQPRVDSYVSVRTQYLQDYLFCSLRYNI